MGSDPTDTPETLVDTGYGYGYGFATD